MGMAFFTSNPNNWELDTCDGCGQIARVKRELKDNANNTATSKSSPKISSFPHRNQKAPKQRGLWKTIENVIVALSA